jgi:hypothetical protein
MLTQKDREALQGDRLAAIEAEINRRKGAKKATADTARQRIRAQLVEMGARLRAAPGWREPTAEEQERKPAGDRGVFSSPAASNRCPQ